MLVLQRNQVLDRVSAFVLDEVGLMRQVGSVDMKTSCSSKDSDCTDNGWEIAIFGKVRQIL